MSRNKLPPHHLRPRGADDDETDTNLSLTEFERDIALMAGNGVLSHGIREALHFWIRSHPGIKLIMRGPRKAKRKEK